MTIAQFFTTLLHSTTAAHILHLQAKNYAEHMALDTFYSDIPGLVDSLIETWQGKNGIIANYTDGFNVPNNAQAFMKQFSAFVTTNRQIVGADSKLQNTIDDILNLADVTLYKLKNLY